MVRMATLVLGIGLAATLGACGDSCESVKADMERIGKEIQKDPTSAFDRASELDELGRKYRELGC